MRCRWVNENNARYIAYHDHEWGIPSHDDRHLFEMLILEGFQAGLSWECILNKRDAFREAFDGFDPHAVSRFDTARIERMMQNTAIVRNRRKLNAAVRNAAVFLSIQQECGSFAQYLWGFTNGAVVHEPYHKRTSSPLSDAVSRDLRNRGMSFVGTTIIYSYLQAVGVIEAHGEECERHTIKER